MRARNNYFQWLQRVRSNLEFESYVRKYCGRESHYGETVAVAQVDAEGGRRDGRFAMSRSEDYESKKGLDNEVKSVTGTLCALFQAIVTGTWQEDGTEISAEKYVGDENPVTYEQLVRFSLFSELGR